MKERAPNIYEKKEAEEKISLTDEEIQEANDLSKREKNKENPLTLGEEKKLKELKTKREEEIKKIIPEFSFKVIMELKGTREESTKQFELADKYFKKIADLSKTSLNRYGIPEGLYSLSLYLEKLKNWDMTPEKVKDAFPMTYQEKKNKFIDLHKKANIANSAGRLIKERTRTELLAKSKSGEILPEEMELLEEVVLVERLKLSAKIPDYLKEAAIYIPPLAEKLVEDNYAQKAYWTTAAKRRDLKNSISRLRERIEKIESPKNNDH